MVTVAAIQEVAAKIGNQKETKHSFYCHQEQDLSNVLLFNVFAGTLPLLETADELIPHSRRALVLSFMQMHLVPPFIINYVIIWV